jgi:DNA-binding transcriptional ArsR family regulator
MVESNPARLDAVFHALADPTRRDMLGVLAVQPQTVSELAAPFSISLAAASKHIKVLEDAGLIDRTIYGRSHLCALNAQPLHAGAEWLRHYERFWQQRLDVLESLLQAEDRAAAAAPAKKQPDPSPPSNPRRRTR